MSALPNIIPKKLKLLRKARGYTQQQLADRLGVQRVTISNYEVGRRSPHIKELEKIANLLGVNLEYFSASTNSLDEFTAKAKAFFEDKDISPEDKSKAYKEILRLYLELDSK